MKKKIIILVAIVVLLVSWVSIAYYDYAKVAISFDKPKFCITTLTADDGGSGKYIGLGYSFDIDGHLTADGWFDVDSYTYKIFGIITVINNWSTMYIGGFANTVAIGIVLLICLACIVIGIDIWRERDRNYLIALFSALVSLVALIVALVK